MYRVFAPVSVSILYLSPTQLGGGSGYGNITVFAINDQQYEVFLSVILSVVNAETGDSKIIWKEEILVSEMSNKMLLNDVNVNNFLNLLDGCTLETCYIKSSSFNTLTKEFLYPNFAFLTEYKNMKFIDSPNILISDINLVSSNSISFTLSVSVTSPFLFLEMKDRKVNDDDDDDDDDDIKSPNITYGIFNNNAGWFSDNNFVAEMGVKYKLVYTAFRESPSFTIEEFQSLLQVRSLQYVTNCNLAMNTIQFIQGVRG